MSKLHILLIAIDNYHPNSKVRNLGGCNNDINIIQSFISQKYSDLNLSFCILRNAEATRVGVLTAFQEHLIANAKAGDTVLFYYSGHGSTAQTAEEFKKFDPKEQDETLVCYDSRLEGNYDITDKEIAVLLSRITEGVHTVFIADSCHSASINRNVLDDVNLKRSRFTKQRKNENDRPLKTYLLEGDNYYADQWKDRGDITVPRSKHILLAGCDRAEEAAETYEDRGLFSTILWNKLQENQNISYADLFTQVRHKIKTYTKKQSPVIEVREGFDPNTVFLRQDVKVNHKRHHILFDKNKWCLGYGAIHGLPTSLDDKDKIRIGIYSEINSKDPIASVGVNKVELKETFLDWDEPSNEKTYYGEIQNLPSGMIIRIEGEEENVNHFFEQYYNSPSPFLEFDRYSSDANYILRVEANQLLVVSANNNELIHGIEGRTNKSVLYIKDILECIEEWERLNNLENEHSKIKDSIDLVFIDETDEDNPIKTRDKYITFDYPKIEDELDNEGDKKALYYSIEARNTSSKALYIALLKLHEDYNSEIFFPCERIPANSNFIILDDDHGLNISNKQVEAIDIFKLIVSEEPFDDYKFQRKHDVFELGEIQPEGTTRRTRATPKRKKKSSDWYTDKITVNTVRQQQSISTRGTSLKDTIIRFAPHSSFKADVALMPAQHKTRNINPAAVLAELFDSDAHKILDLNEDSTRSIQDKTIIELSGIENKEALKKEPLVLHLNQNISSEDTIIPVAFDGEFIIPFGETKVSSDGSPYIEISDFPDIPDRGRKRSLKKALWFCLLKVLGFKNKAFRLRHSRFNKKGELIRDRKSIKSKVETAEKILIVVHGIIGDTKDMAKNLMFLVGEGDEYQYDMMLSFDYENLNEPIEKIAGIFNEQLIELDLVKNHKKQVDIIAHSMGGLVSRYMIENINQGNSGIDRLFMFGTPNGGSPFGDIPGYLSLFKTLTTVALNFGKHLLPSLLPLVKVLSYAEKGLKPMESLLVTLGQMKIEGEFIKGLYQNSHSLTEYFIIAGDTTKYALNKDSRISRFVEKGLVWVGDSMNDTEPNDIAVGVDQILEVPAVFNAEKAVVVGHHMNYFEDGAAMEQLKKILFIKNNKV